ncbi:MAG: porphobilinogen synthase [Pseudomonadota bacterium]
MSQSPEFRFRRLRQHPVMRQLLRETQLTQDDVILPIFVEESIDARVEIDSMPGVFRYPESMLAERVQQVWNKGIRSIILFGVSHHKDATGSDALKEDGLVARMCRIAKHAQPDMYVISDTCFCEYTHHGHCGVVHDDELDNDLTLAQLQTQAVVAAKAGADMIAPSGMMDGMVAVIRSALDDAGFQSVPIMSYSTKFASAFYGPFRDAVDSNFKGTRTSYQLDPANVREAIGESIQDEAEGADVLMVKPGMAYLDVLHQIRNVSRRPLAVYQVSGEYAMIKAASQAGVIDERAIVMESCLAFKRAGADLIITYFAEDILSYLNA